MTAAQEPVDPESLATSFRIILVLILLVLALSGAVVYLFLRPPMVSDALVAQDPEVLRQVVARLAGEGETPVDSHPDSDLGRIQLAGHRGERWGVEIAINQLGLREREIELPKPSGVLRVVLLGDSYIFGWRVAAEERLGVALERWLNEGATEGVRVECLHIGVPSWTFRNQAVFLRRLLTPLDPDLVLQVSLPNDIEDGYGVRGFGVAADFSPQHPGRADSLVSAGFPLATLGLSRMGYVRLGQDGESRRRFEEARQDLQQLMDVLDDRGVPYRMLFHWSGLLPVAREHLGQPLGDERMVYLGSALGGNPDFWSAENDRHWNAAGHLEAARVIYALILREGLLPSLDLASRPEAEAAWQRVAEAGLEESRTTPDIPVGGFKLRRIQSVLEPPNFDRYTGSQIHGGIDTQGRTSPYASVLLRRQGTHLFLEGRAFDRPELDGAVVKVAVDGEVVGELRLTAGQTYAEEWPLPESAGGYDVVSASLESTDYVYAADDPRHCVVFHLDRIGIR